MAWVWILVLPVALVAGVWIIETVRSGQQHRYGLRLEELRARERLLERREAAERAPEPVCGCGHHLAKHDRRQRCHEVVRVPSGWDAERRPVGFEPGPCTCQRYVGPQPLSEIYAEELTDPDQLPGRRAGDVAELAPGAGAADHPPSAPGPDSQAPQGDHDAASGSPGPGRSAGPDRQDGPEEPGGPAAPGGGTGQG